MSIKLKEKDFDKAGKVIDASVNAGALIDSINFELSREKRDEIKLKLLAEAAKDGKLKAEIIVSALGDELGDVKTINVNDYNYQPHVYYKNSYDVLDRGYAEATPPTTIMPTDLTVSASISLVFEVF
jgi:uncharacterized protein YggE